MAELVRLAGGDPAALPRLLAQVEHKTGRSFAATTNARADDLAQSITLQRKQDKVAMVFKLVLEGYVCSPLEHRLAGLVSKELQNVVRDAPHSADFFAFSNKQDWIPYALWLSRRKAVLTGLRISVGSDETAIVKDLLRSCDLVIIALRHMLCLDSHAVPTLITPSQRCMKKCNVSIASMKSEGR